MRKIIVLLLAMTTALLSLSVASESAGAKPPASASLQAQVTQILREHPGGVQISPTQIAWHGGAVVLNLQPSTSNAVTAQAGAGPTFVTVHNCPYGSYCFYALKNFGGAMLQLQYCPPAASSYPVYFSDYGFENKTSSTVVNRSINYLNVYELIPTGGWNYLWSDVSYASQSYVGTTNDNRADMVYCFG